MVKMIDYIVCIKIILFLVEIKPTISQDANVTVVSSHSSNWTTPETTPAEELGREENKQGPAKIVNNLELNLTTTSPHYTIQSELGEKGNETFPPKISEPYKRVEGVFNLSSHNASYVVTSGRNNSENDSIGNQTFHQELDEVESIEQPVFDPILFHETDFNLSENHNTSYHIETRDRLENGNSNSDENYTKAIRRAMPTEKGSNTQKAIYYDTLDKSTSKSHNMLYAYLTAVVVCAVAVMLTIYYRIYRYQNYNMPS